MGTVARAPIGEGHRRPTLFALAGKMRKQGLPLESIIETLLALNRSFQPPLTEAEVRKTAAGIERYPASAVQDSPTLKPDLVRLSDVGAREVDWLWEPFIPGGMMTMLDGDPSVGKSYIALALSAELSRGRLRDGRIVEPANTLYLSVENPIAEAVRPRFDALGGDASRFFVLKGSLFAENGEEQRGAVTLTDIPILEEAIVKTGARLVIIDPIQSYLGATVDLHRSNETRPVLDGLSKLAERHNCSVLILRHLSKQTGGKAVHRGLGSVDLSGAVRSELLAGSLPDAPEARALVHVQSNVGRLGRTLGYSIDSQGHFTWTGESPITAAELLAAPEDPEARSVRDDAVEWLRDFLADGSRPACKPEDLKGTGISFRSLQRAKAELHVRSIKSAVHGAWLWELPSNPQERQRTPNSLHTEKLAALGSLAALEERQLSPKDANNIYISPLDSQERQISSVTPPLASLAEKGRVQ